LVPELQLFVYVVVTKELICECALLRKISEEIDGEQKEAKYFNLAHSSIAKF